MAVSCLTQKIMNTLIQFPVNPGLDVPARGALNPPPRILVVDGESYTRQLITEALNHSGYQVDTAEDGAIAWEALERNRYDLLVTDNNMGRLTGPGLVKKLHAAHRALPVVMVSGGMMSNEEPSRLKTPQIDATLMKPFTIHDIIRTVRQVLGSADRAREQAARPALISLPLAQESLCAAAC